ncbi:hypothetical protein B0H13DRAFT_2370336 [Mycena leptocephala]|nr:hypothetical protein B0H13DRAFT_2370336 [Mycena leptocephala]
MLLYKWLDTLGQHGPQDASTLVPFKFRVPFTTKSSSAIEEASKGEILGVEIPATHQYRSSRVLTYIEERKAAVAEFETRLNTLGCYILFRVCAQFEGEDHTLDRGFPPPAPAQAPCCPPVRVAAAPPPLPLLVPCMQGKAMSPEPDIAVLEQGLASGSDNQPLLVLRKSKGKKKAVVASRESREKSRAGSEDEAGAEPEIITCTVKVKKGKRQSAVELTGPQNEYDSQLWHDRNDLFVIDAPTTSTGGNKIVMHAYLFDENHLCFSSTWKRRIALSSLPARTVYTRGKGCVRCLLSNNECVRPRYGDETPTAACSHCRADNATCELASCRLFANCLLLADTALPDVNTEWMELQLTLMLEIADKVRGVGTTERLLVQFMHHLCSLGTNRDILEARRAIFGSENSSVAGGRSRHHTHSSFRGEGDSESNDSGAEVEGGKGGGNGDVSMGQNKGSADEEPLLTASASTSGRSSPLSAPSVCLTMDSVEIPSRTVHPPVVSPGDPRHMFSPTLPRQSSGSWVSPPKFPQAALLSPPAAVSPALSLSTSVFGKPGLLLGSKPNKTIASEGFAADGEMLEEGELDAEGEIVVGTSGRASFAHGPKSFRLLYIPEFSELPSGGWVEQERKNPLICYFVRRLVVFPCLLYALPSGAKM